jgi:OmpA-OmpF porin, OOP family
VGRAGPDAMIVLEGHADHRGDESLNRELSRQRALSVARQLEKLGVERSRIRVDYVGEDETVDSTELWRARRVDIQITGGP